jgi:hypothetical protein
MFAITLRIIFDITLIFHGNLDRNLCRRKNFSNLKLLNGIIGDNQLDVLISQQTREHKLNKHINVGIKFKFCQKFENLSGDLQTLDFSETICNEI